MKSSEPEPLWRVVVGDTEPWRRGRWFLIIFAGLTLLTQVILFGSLILWGAVEALLISGIAAALFWFQFYFIWIGVHWVRWLNATVNAIYGFYLFFWGIGWSSTVLILSGLYSFTVGAYLGLAPSVYFFAQRQRETKRWPEAFALAGVLLLLLLSLGGGLVGLLHYKHELEAEAYAFANEAFERVFAKHDTYFVLERTTGETLRMNGRERLTRFLSNATILAGDVREIQPAQGKLEFRYAFPASLVTEGYMMTEGVGTRGTVQLHLRINDLEGDWRMDNLGWVYPDSVRQNPQRRPR